MPLEKAKRKPHFWIKTTGDHTGKACMCQRLVDAWVAAERTYVYSCGFLCCWPFNHSSIEMANDQSMWFLPCKKKMDISGYQWMRYPHDDHDQLTCRWPTVISVMFEIAFVKLKELHDLQTEAAQSQGSPSFSWVDLWIDEISMWRCMCICIHSKILIYIFFYEYEFECVYLHTHIYRYMSMNMFCIFKGDFRDPQ